MGDAVPPPPPIILRQDTAGPPSALDMPPPPPSDLPPPPQSAVSVEAGVGSLPLPPPPPIELRQKTQGPPPEDLVPAALLQAPPPVKYPMPPAPVVSLVEVRFYTVPKIGGGRCMPVFKVETRSGREYKSRFMVKPRPCVKGEPLVFRCPPGTCVDGDTRITWKHSGFGKAKLCSAWFHSAYMKHGGGRVFDLHDEAAAAEGEVRAMRGLSDLGLGSGGGSSGPEEAAQQNGEEQKAAGGGGGGGESDGNSNGGGDSDKDHQHHQHQLPHVVHTLVLWKDMIDGANKDKKMFEKDFRFEIDWMFGATTAPATNGRGGAGAGGGSAGGAGAGGGGGGGGGGGDGSAGDRSDDETWVFEDGSAVSRSSIGSMYEAGYREAGGSVHRSSVESNSSHASNQSSGSLLSRYVRVCRDSHS